MNKLHVLIVDDELASRETLRRLVDWERLGFAPPVLAENGQRAMERIEAEPFDLVLTDIEMPILNGIELIGRIREQNPEQRVVVISCHEKFEYAQQALRLGVADYLIKDLVTPNELSALVYSLTLQEEAKGRTDSERVLVERLRSAAEGEVLPSGPLPCGYGAVFCAVLDEYDRLLLEVGSEALEKSVGDLIDALDCAACYDTGAGTLYVLRALPGNTNSMLYFLNASITAANAMRTETKRAGLQSVSIGVSDPTACFEGLTAACAQAAEAAGMRIICGPDKTAVYNTIQLKRDVVDSKYTEYLLRRVADLCYNANTACFKLIDKLYAVDLSSGLADVHYYRYVNSRLWTICVHAAQSRGREGSLTFGREAEEVDRMESPAQMAQFFKSFLGGLFSEDAPTGADGIVDQALRLIEREYEKDISLGDIAERLHANKSYLSRTFKEQTGENLTHYIMDKKITRAKYLLCNTQMKLYEVSDSLGFASPQYFSQVFKRHTGFPPGEYKQAMLTDGIWMKYLMDREEKPSEPGV